MVDQEHANYGSSDEIISSITKANNGKEYQPMQQMLV